MKKKMNSSGKSTVVAPRTIRSQIDEQRRKVDFDSYDVTVDELVRRVDRGRIEIAPVYQRQFRWDPERQSALIESFILGIPVPTLFMATNNVAGELIQWEVVDGLQRLLTLVNFIGSGNVRDVARLTSPPLTLSGLEKLDSLNGLEFGELPPDIQDLLLDRPAKVIVLNDKSSKQVRFDLFERLNTGGLRLTDQEVRECVFRGDFIEALGRLASTAAFRSVVNIPEAKLKDGTPEEFVLRFFAFLDGYQKFDHSVKDFLNNFAEVQTENPKDLTSKEEEFVRVFDFLKEVFPDGIRRNNRRTTPVNLFEGVAVGAALALRKDPKISKTRNPQWVSEPELTAMTSVATNSRNQVVGRIEFSRDMFLRP
ncbi:hypothetical protein ABIE37_003122 [Arthrobacter bambusae]|uniref:GmrSD restriction endonucleases N-terminal domain-containing protein n=1 Tax=Arthrobacter bambusae TaxID=1338426 RepID=A0ABV2P971_9MICC